MEQKDKLDIHSIVHKDFKSNIKRMRDIIDALDNTFDLLYKKEKENENPKDLVDLYKYSTDLLFSHMDLNQKLKYYLVKLIPNQEEVKK